MVIWAGHRERVVRRAAHRRRRRVVKARRFRPARLAPPVGRLPAGAERRGAERRPSPPAPQLPLLCPARKLPFWTAERPARPHESATQKTICCGERNGRLGAPGGCGPSSSDDEGDSSSVDTPGPRALRRGLACTWVDRQHTVRGGARDTVWCLSYGAGWHARRRARRAPSPTACAAQKGKPSARNCRILERLRVVGCSGAGRGARCGRAR
jgi:hypothetical protein